METIKIEKGVPLPHGVIGGRTKYPFDKMKNGDSFCIRVNKKDYATLGSRLSVAVAYYAKKTVQKFVCRKQKRPLGIRCWRIK